MNGLDSLLSATQGCIRGVDRALVLIWSSESSSKFILAESGPLLLKDGSPCFFACSHLSLRGCIKCLAQRLFSDMDVCFLADYHEFVSLTSEVSLYCF